MTKYLSKRFFIVVNVALFIIEVLLIYLLINSYLYKDYISPNDVSFYEYLMYKITSFV